jgi:hypothetical protein
MKTLVICDELSDLKFDDFIFEADSSLFIHSKEINSYPSSDGDDKLWEKKSDIYQVHQNMVLLHELVDRGILQKNADFMQDFYVSECIIEPQDIANGVLLKYEILIF